MNSIRNVAIGLCLALLVVGTAQAGQLFPPENASGATTCPNGQVLKWSGNSVVCEDPSPGVNVASCAAGKVMTGVNHGVPVCVTPTVTPTPLTVSCPGGQVLTGLSNGSPVCTTPSAASVSVSCPSGYVLSAINSGNPSCVPVASVTGCTNPKIGYPIYYGTVTNCNAGVLTLNPKHLNCATMLIGYTMSCN